MALLVLVLAVMPLLASQNVTEDGPQASILSTKVSRKAIETQFIGGGQLAGSSTEEVTLPEEVKITEYLVGNGDTVKAGDPIARVDKVTLMTALAEVQETLDYLAGEISDAADDSQSDTVTAQAGGLVKILYGKPGDNVRDVMLKNGALAVLSLDGRMAVNIDRRTDFSYGTTVCVTLSDDTEVEGRVESSAGGVLTVSVEDQGYAIGETVVVHTEDGTRLGSGELYIHSPWKAAAYDGTITKVNAKESDTLSAGKKLYELEVSGNTAEFKILQSQRQEYEELMQKLFAMYQSGCITAPCDGLVTGVDDNGAFLLAAAPAEPTWGIQLLRNVTWNEEPSHSAVALNWPGFMPPSAGGDSDEGQSGSDTPGEETTPATTYTVRVGKVNADGSVTICATYYGITSLSSVPTAVGSGSGSESWPTDVLYDTSLNAYPGAVAEGDFLLEATDDMTGTVFYVYAGSGADDETQQGQDSENSGMAGSMGGAGGMGGGSMQVFEPYSLETVTIANLTSQEEMTLEITVDEQDIAKIARGQQATVTVEALPGQFFPAEVTSIGNSGTNEGGSSKFTASLTLSRSGDMLPGMNASAYLTLGSREDVLAIPVAALVEEENRTVVYTGYDEKSNALTNPVAVTTGVSDGEFVEILSGLQENDTVWYEYYDTLEISNALPQGRGFGF